MVFKNSPRNEEVQPGLETPGSARFKCWATKARRRSLRGRRTGDQHLPCFVLLVNTKQLDAEGSGGAPVDGAEVAGLFRQRDGR